MLKLSGAWLCGLSSVPQGSGLSRLRSSEPNETLEYMQTYTDDPLVITRGTIEDPLAQLKVLKKMHGTVLRITNAKSCLCPYKSNIYAEC